MAKRGRPTDYDPTICSDIPGMFADGQSKAEVAVTLGVARSTLALWEKEHPEFSEAIKKGVEQSQAWWERLGRLGASGHVEINPTTWIFNMKNRFGWADKQDVTSGGKALPHGPMRVVIVDPKSEGESDESETSGGASS